ncbi:LysM peptidoglycan-binding domain-containing protein [Bacillus marinisedimentorum]|uniref:LysM peptidoglycan-binding domain-containing protein n=1 Tax=Bacillus marinisedimentorum TaxID=1821260 RepID=UPI0008725136|nr:LysM peptidoglycan-binding domain-containing protein [Bacillus marinisedimentorum]
MINKLDRKEWMIIGGAAFMVFMLLMALYFFYIRPHGGELTRLENELETEQKLLAALEETRVKTGGGESAAVDLQQKIPVKLFQEQVILDIERAETVSGSLLLKADFAGPEEGAEKKASAAGVTEEHPKPEGLIPMDTVLEVEAEDYYALEDFLKTFEKQKRHYQIVSFSFTGNPERTALSERQNPLAFSVKLRNYYYPSLAGKFEFGPAFHAPQPAYKENPLVSGAFFNETSGSEEGDRDTASVEDSVQSESSGDDTAARSTIMTHTVLSGETLYSISMKYFNSRSGETVIRNYNNLNGDNVHAGQKLKIPVY